MTSAFFIPTKSDSLAHYFSRGLILPSKFYSNKPDDLQDTFANYGLLISSSKWIDNSDCSLEIVFTPQEINQLIEISAEFFIFQNCIPISRIKSIYFLNEDQKDTTIWNIENGTAFVPRQLLKVEDLQTGSLEALNRTEMNTLTELPNDLIDKSRRFDVALGAFAFMRIKKKSDQTFNDKYISTLSYFNKLIAEQLEKAANDGKTVVDNRYVGLFSTKIQSEWSKWLPYLFKNVEQEDFLRIAAQEGVRVDRKLGLIKIDSIPVTSHLYELAILSTYGNSKRKSIEDLIADLEHGTIPQEKIEDVSITFGMNNGYSKFRNAYKLGSTQYVIKFRLESKLEYYIIESVYQFAFNGVRDSYSFDYLDSWIPTNKNQDTDENFITYRILDTDIVSKRKPSIVEIFLDQYATQLFKAVIQLIGEGKKKSQDQSQISAALGVRSNLIDQFEDDLVRAINNRVKLEVTAIEETKTSSSIDEASKIKDINDRSTAEDYQDRGEQGKILNEGFVAKETKVDYNKMKVADLRKTAKLLGMKDFKTSKKEQLIAFIKNNPTLL